MFVGVLTPATSRPLMFDLGPIDVGLVFEALNDQRVHRALLRAIFDVKVRRDFSELRAEGRLVGEVEASLAERYCCSVETIRTIIYHKRKRQTRAQRG